MKLNLKKINFNQSATWNMWYQMGIDIDALTVKLDVTAFYFPQKEQDKLVEYIIDNRYKMKFYKRKHKQAVRNYINAEILAYFPRGNK